MARSVTEHRTFNVGNPCSNPLFYRFEAWSFSFSTTSHFTRRINEYLAIDGGGNVGELYFRNNCSMSECFPNKSSWYRKELICQSMKYFDISDGLDTALYKNTLCLEMMQSHLSMY